MAYHSNGGFSGDERESRSGDDRPDSDLSDKPIYLLEHLATFTVNKETGIVYPADGMRRLLQLEKTTGIWSQKMQLCLDNQWVLIMDYETGNIIERFPASLIQEPTAFTSNDPMEMYNNILVFIVASGSGSRSEMHIFQCQSISAVHLVEDLKQLRNGKVVTQHRETIPQPPMKTSTIAIRDQYGMREVSGGYHHETDSELGGINDETSSTSSDKYERDVTVLNHCFDDIEKFIARLQHAAAASRELERRRRNRKSKKKDPGEGLLTLRTRPPLEKEFIDIFAKFKLSFNLLAKLKAHIHDPNAPELVHFLFTPLALIVEAASDTYYESHLPARVVNPLLTREAVNLLINCVTSKETELWRSLGDAWTIPRDQWKGHVGSYHPVFFDGWSPDYPVVDELEHPTTPTNPKRRIEAHHNYGGSNNPAVGGAGDYDFEGPTTPRENHKFLHHHHVGDRNVGNSASTGVGGGGVVSGVGGTPGAGATGFRDFSARSDISIDSIERNGGGSGIGNSASGGDVTTSVSASNTAIQTLVGGIQNLGAHQPNSGPAQDQNIEQWLDELHARGAKIVQVTYPRTANNDKELTVVRGEFLEVLDDSRKWWKARNRRGQVAHVPHTIITPFNYNENGDIFSTPLYAQNYNKAGGVGGNAGRPNDSVSDSQGSGSGIPAPNSSEWVRNKHIETDRRRSSVKGYNNHQLHQLPQHKGGRDTATSTGYNRQLARTTSQSSQRTTASVKQQRPVPAAVPPPPPPPPPPPTTTCTITPSCSTPAIIAPEHARSLPRSNTSTIKSTSSSGSGTIGPQNEMQEELKRVLRMFREKRRNLDIVKTPGVYIQQTSSPPEIEQWLRAKGFSESVVKKLHGLNGDELFALTREALEEYCGLEEGKRLASQITIQRNVSGYKTARTSELQAILARARQKTEQQEQQQQQQLQQQES